MEAVINSICDAVAAAAEKEDGSPALIYIGIGCAGSAGQQWPDFLETISYNHLLLLLVDPCLEDPPLATREKKLGDNVCVFALREKWNWGPTTMVYINRMLESSPSVRIIVHDFTGENINRYYPYYSGHPRLLFDPTYGIPGCVVDLSDVRILFDKKGGFLCPLTMLLRDLVYYPDVLRREIESRRDAICHFVYPRYLSEIGAVPRQPCHDEDYVAAGSWQLRRVYGVGRDCLEAMRCFLADLKETCEFYVGKEGMPDNGDKSYLQAVDNLRRVINDKLFASP